RVDLAAGDLLRHHAQLCEDLARKAADAQLQSLQVLDGLDLLAVPAAHLRAGVAGEERMDAVFLEEVVENRVASAHVPPRVELATVHAEGDRRPEGEGGILA